MKTIDLRSDTVTQPTLEMRQVMANAVVGDDVFGEDPTINELQELGAEMMGMEAGLFVASGTMGNLAAILTHCDRGDEVIVGNRSHTFLYEAGGMSVLGGVHSHQLKNQADGTLILDEIEDAIRPDDPHDPITKLICLENTHNRCGGKVLTPSYMKAVKTIAEQHDLRLHLDGARIFNAAAAQGIAASELSQYSDTITFCLSKGLCAPVGSILCGSKTFIKKALRARKMLGGGMRQAGILAAAGLLALRKMTTRLCEDHDRAAQIAEHLALIPEVTFPLGMPITNMVFFNLPEQIIEDADAIESLLAERGVLISATAKRQFRVVTHYWISDEDAKTAADTISVTLLEQMNPRRDDHLVRRI